MNELVYLFKVADSEALFEKLGYFLLLDEAPHYVRVSTLAPLTNYGYGPGSEGALLAWLDEGLVYGDLDNTEIPTTFVPWHNISYISSGDALKMQLDAGASQLEEMTEEP